MISGVILFLNACDTPSDKLEVINAKASLPPSFNFEKLGLKVITSTINKRQHTMSVLYGNKSGLEAITVGAKEVSGNGMLALVTWRQQEDPHWYGANIPGDLLSVELIQANSHTSLDYKRFEGKSMAVNADTSGQSKRVKFILDLKPSVMP